jgi:CBS domain-containing protein
MQVEDVMTKEVRCCSPDDSLEYAAQLMWEHDCGCLPVCGGSSGDTAYRTIGVVTDRDICMCALFQHKPLSELHVRDAMATRVLACQPGDSLEHAERMMRDEQIRRLPVVNGDGNLLGLISLADLAREATRPAQTQAEVELANTLAAICTPRQLNA